MDQGPKLHPEIINLLEESIGGILLEIGIGKDVLEKSTNVQSVKAKINKMGVGKKL